MWIIQTLIGIVLGLLLSAGWRKYKKDKIQTDRRMKEYEKYFRK